MPLADVGDLGFDAVLFDAGGVLVLPDPTVLAPLLAPYGGSTSLDRHRRAHYAAMAVRGDRIAVVSQFVATWRRVRGDGRYWARTSDLQLVELALSQLS